MILQYCGDRSVQWGDDIAIVGVTSVQWGLTSVLCRVFSTMGGIFSTMGDTFSTVGDNISNVEVAQYSGDEDLKHYQFSKIIEIFSTAYFTLKSDRPHITVLNC